MKEPLAWNASQPTVTPRLRGRRSFVAATVVLLLLGAIHMAAVVRSLVAGPISPEEVEMERASRAFKVVMGPFHADGYGLIQILSASYSILLLFAGAVNLLALGPMAGAGRLKPLTVANVALSGALFAVALTFQFPPPMVFSLAALVLFAVSWARQ